MARDKRLLFLQREFPFNGTLKPVGSNVSEPGLRRIRVSFQGGHSRSPLTAGLLFQGGDFSTHRLPSAGASAGLSSPHWWVCSALGCPWPLLARR